MARGIRITSTLYRYIDIFKGLFFYYFFIIFLLFFLFYFFFTLLFLWDSLMAAS